MIKFVNIARVSLCAIAFVAIAPAATILNSSFEQPTTISFSYNPLDPTGGWTFSGRSGVASNTFFTPPPPQGSQAAFLQQYLDQTATLTSVSQSLTGVTLTPSVLNFYIASRAGFAANPLDVFYGSQNLGTFTPSSTAFTLVSVAFTPTATSAVLRFTSKALTNSDLNTAIDAVSLSVVPEPSTALLILPGLALLALGCRYQKALAKK